MRREPTNQIALDCEACGKEFLGEPPIMCCSGRECGCIGRPIDPVVCSMECFDKIINKYKKMKTKPTEALRYIRTGIESNVDTAMSTITRHDAGIATEIAFKEDQSNPKIKQLEWEKSGEYWEAITPIGAYSITLDFGVYLVLYDMDNDVDGEWRSLAKAKAAAQADFEKRIKECLE